MMSLMNLMSKKIQIWGLTGMLGAGKSLAMAHLRQLGFPTADADAFARIAVDPTVSESALVLKALVDSFGSQILLKDGQLDRAYLRTHVLTSPENQKKLEAIMHPRILDLAMRQISEWESAGHSLGFVEGTRLVESGFVPSLAGLILVVAPRDLRLQRVQDRDGCTLEQAERLDSLQNESAMLGAASFAWMNTAKPEFLIRQIESQIEDLGSLAKTTKQL